VGAVNVVGLPQLAPPQAAKRERPLVTVSLIATQLWIHVPPTALEGSQLLESEAEFTLTLFVEIRDRLAAASMRSPTSGSARVALRIDEVVLFIMVCSQ
jgi:hypothetical protein